MAKPPPSPPSERDKAKRSSGTKIGRDAKTGRFIPVSEAKRRPSTTVVESIGRSKPKKK